MNRKVTFKNVRYGMLVEVIRSDGYHSGCKVHFYNKKGVLIGNYYEFAPYERLRLRNPHDEDALSHPRYFYGKRLELIKHMLFKILLRTTDVLLRFTQNKMD